MQHKAGISLGSSSSATVILSLVFSAVVQISGFTNEAMDQNESPTVINAYNQAQDSALENLVDGKNAAMQEIIVSAPVTCPPGMYCNNPVPVPDPPKLTPGPDTVVPAPANCPPGMYCNNPVPVPDPPKLDPGTDIIVPAPVTCPPGMYCNNPIPGPTPDISAWQDARNSYLQAKNRRARFGL